MDAKHLAILAAMMMTGALSGIVMYAWLVSNN